MKINGNSHCCLTLLTIVSASVVLGAGSVSAAGSKAAELIVADSKANTLIAQRQELKDEISKFGEKNADQAAIAIKKLLNLENPDDIIYLLGLMIQNPKSPMAEEIKKAILAYGKKEYLVTALNKAGQDKSVEINIAAANLLIDMKEELEGLKVMASLIKKGVIDKRIIDIMDRVPERERLNGIKMEDSQMIYNIEVQQALENIGKADVFPQNVRVFSMLLNMGYYGAYLDNEKAVILDVLNIDSSEYLLNAIRLLKKSIELQTEGSGVAKEILGVLSKSKDTEVAHTAEQIIVKFDAEQKEETQRILRRERKQPSDRAFYALQYLKADHTEADVRFLIDVLRTDPDAKVRMSIIQSIMHSKYIKTAVADLVYVAKNDPIINVRIGALHVLIVNGYENEAFELVGALIRNNHESNGVIKWDPFRYFEQPGIKKKSELLLKELLETKNNFIRGYAQLCLLLHYQGDFNQYANDIMALFKDPGLKEETAKYFMEQLGYVANKRQDCTARVLTLIRQLEDYNNPVISSLAKQEANNIAGR